MLRLVLGEVRVKHRAHCSIVARGARAKSPRAALRVLCLTCALFACVTDDNVRGGGYWGTKGAVQGVADELAELREAGRLPNQAAMNGVIHEMAQSAVNGAVHAIQRVRLLRRLNGSGSPVSDVAAEHDPTTVTGRPVMVFRGAKLSVNCTMPELTETAATAETPDSPRLSVATVAKR